MTWVAPDRQAEDAFWLFVKERQDVWHNRFVLGAHQRDWTTNPILSRVKFTNVYRMLDRNTQYVVEQILEPCYGQPLCTAYFSAIFRWFNRIETYQDIVKVVAYKPNILAFDWPCIAAELNRINDDKKRKVFTSAYICGFADLGHGSFGDNCVFVLQELYKVVCDIDTDWTLRQACEHLQKAPRIGHFIAYQMALDWTLPLAALKGNRLIQNFDPNSWTDVGPGCAKGLAAMGVKGPDAVMQRAVHGLWAKHVEMLHPMGFMWVRGSDGYANALTLGDVENCLCEYSKYARIRGGGHAKTVYRPVDHAWKPKYKILPVFGV
jgi:hypothetical protein